MVQLRGTGGSGSVEGGTDGEIILCAFGTWCGGAWVVCCMFVTRVRGGKEETSCTVRSAPFVPRRGVLGGVVQVCLDGTGCGWR